MFAMLVWLTLQNPLPPLPSQDCSQCTEAQLEAWFTAEPIEWGDD